MPHVVVSAETEVYTVREPDPTDSWDIGDEEGHVVGTVGWIVPIANAYYGSSCGKDMDDVSPGDTVWAVVVDYESGCTFGRTGGHSKVVDIFKNSATANALRTALENSGDAWEVDFEGQRYYCGDWKGYFESLNAIGIWPTTLQNRDW